MFVNQWEILLVDDEPDVISISKLAMRNFEVYGLPLVIHRAASKAEALEMLNNRPDRHTPMTTLTVAIIDVVMENDRAGLELCQAIREEMDNRLTQLFIRTGQPGVAPERQVIDRYDINGYFTKAELTEDKLYSLVKSGVRQYYWSWLNLMSVHFLNTVISASDSRENIVTQFGHLLDLGDTAHTGTQRYYYRVNDTTLTLRGWDEQTGNELIDKLSQLEGVPLSDDGDKFALDGDGHVLVTIAGRPDRAEVKGLIESAFTPPIDAIRVVHNVFVGLGTAWQKAQ